MTRPAKIKVRGAHQSWQCPCCNRTLGEVFTDRVVVKAGDRMISFPTDAPVEQVCPRCSETSALYIKVDAA